jgi:hypothetical protein
MTDELLEGDLPSPEEMAYAYRNSLLLICDWTQLPDVDLTAAQVAQWRVYRQELRDLPSLPDWPNVTFPTAPTD